MKTNSLMVSLCVLGGWAAMGAARAQTATETVLHSFGNFPYGSEPYGTLTRDSNGNLYGTAYSGGASNLGVVFKLSPSGSYQVLHSFTGGSDGANPYAGVTIGPTGDLYGTTNRGGTADAGVVYKIDASGQEAVLYSFTGGADGGYPYAGVVADAGGNLYGTTPEGGVLESYCARGCGVVYKITPSGQETVLYGFPGGAAGQAPQAGLIMDANANLYGTTVSGGNPSREGYGCGVVYKVTPAGQETVVYAFTCGADGASPSGGLTMDSTGDLYGAAQYGGTDSCYRGCGVIYEVTPVGRETVLYSFTAASGVTNPVSNLTRDLAGNLYGTAHSGGQNYNGGVFQLSSSGSFSVLFQFQAGTEDVRGYGGFILDPAGNLYGVTALSTAPAEGMVYKLDPSGQETTLYGFAPAPGGTSLVSGLTRDAAGNLYGTAWTGGTSNLGVVFRLDPSGNETVLHTFGGPDGAYPESGVILDSAGNLYGTTSYGGSAGNCYVSECGWGVAYKLAPSGQETILHVFSGGADGAEPAANLILDSAGNLYGTTAGGGAFNAGTVFKLSPAGQETILYTFTGGSDGGYPHSGLTFDSAGNLYGTTEGGGAMYGGVVYKLDPTGNETVLYTFTMYGNGGGGPTGAFPTSGVVLDSAGNLYGTTWAGGESSFGCEGYGCGVVYEMSEAGEFSLLFSFDEGGAGGAIPVAGLVRDSAGNLYGTAAGGGMDYDVCTGSYQGASGGCGLVFRVDPYGNETVIYRFTGADGGNPWAGVILDSSGNIYGTTYGGGTANGGVVYKLTPP